MHVWNVVETGKDSFHNRRFIEDPPSVTAFEVDIPTVCRRRYVCEVKWVQGIAAKKNGADTACYAPVAADSSQKLNRRGKLTVTTPIVENFECFPFARRSPGLCSQDDNGYPMQYGIPCGWLCVCPKARTSTETRWCEAKYQTECQPLIHHSLCGTM